MFVYIFLLILRKPKYSHDVSVISIFIHEVGHTEMRKLLYVYANMFICMQVHLFRLGLFIFKVTVMPFITC